MHECCPAASEFVSADFVCFNWSVAVRGAETLSQVSQPASAEVVQQRASVALLFAFISA